MKTKVDYLEEWNKFVSIDILNLFLKFCDTTARGGALCSELAENVQKITLVGSFNFGSTRHPFGGLTQ